MKSLQIFPNSKGFVRLSLSLTDIHNLWASTHPRSLRRICIFIRRGKPLYSSHTWGQGGVQGCEMPVFTCSVRNHPLGKHLSRLIRLSSSQEGKHEWVCFAARPVLITFIWEKAGGGSLPGASRLGDLWNYSDAHGNSSFKSTGKLPDTLERQSDREAPLKIATLGSQKHEL